MSHPHYTTSDIARFQEHVIVTPFGCHDSTFKPKSDGYSQMVVGGRLVYMHRIAWEIANGPIPEGMCVLHHCDRRSCCNPEHLFLGSRGDNNVDMHSKGRACVGSRHHSARLTERDVHEIRSALSSGESQSSIARRYSVSVQSINNILHRKTWKHI